MYTPAQRGPATQRPPTGAPCYRCGRSNHDPKDCRLRESVCHFCNKKGHIAPACRGRQSKNGQKPTQKTFRGKRQPSQQTSYVAADDGKSETELPLFMVGNSASNPLYANVLVNGKDLVMEVDTGAAGSIISEMLFKQLFPKVKLDKSSIQLRTYTGEKLPVLGQINVRAQYEDQTINLDLVVVAGNGPTLLGRNWLLQLQLDWAAIRRVESKPQPLGLEPLLAKHSKLFADELGTISPFKAKLRVQPGAAPKFCKPRSVPYAAKQAVENELDRLESSGILEKVSYSEWAAPIVVVPKKDGKIRLCGDYKSPSTQHLRWISIHYHGQTICLLHWPEETNSPRSICHKRTSNSSWMRNLRLT